MRFIQPNPPSLRFRLVFDIDRQGGALAWEDGAVAPPNWTAANPVNGHAHLGYELECPVVTSPAGRAKPVRYLAAIEIAYLKALKADLGYAGHKCKNPMHSDWKVHVWKESPYELGELAEYIDLTRSHKVRLEEYGVGRNIILFNTLRHWAYRNIEEYRTHGAVGWVSWLRAVHIHAQSIASNFPQASHPFLHSEIKATSKSVARWVWRNHSGKAESDRRFRCRQAQRGTKKGKAKREKGLQLLRDNPKISNAAIAELLNVTRQTVNNWRRNG